MDDRELTEWAAKAAGYKVHFWSDKCARMDVPGHPAFSPLTDDGDAFRLAVNLRMDIHFETQHLSIGEIDIVEIFYNRDPSEGICRCAMTSLDADPEAAIRRAITRAAATIGNARND